MKEQGKNVLLEKLKDWRWAVQHGHTKRRDFRNWHDDDEQAYQQIRQLIENQPGVDEEFIEKWIDKLKIKVRQRWNDDYYVNPSKEDLKQMLKEAGLKIKGEK